MAELLGPREAAVARELTKLHEELRRGSLSELAAYYGQTEQPRGEITLVVAPPLKDAPDPSRIDQLLELTLPFMPVKPASSLVAEATGAPRREVYLRALALKGEAGARRPYRPDSAGRPSSKAARPRCSRRCSPP